MHAQCTFRHSLTHVHLGLSLFQVPHFAASLFPWLLFFLSLLPDDLAVNPGLNPLAIFYLVFYSGLSLVIPLLEQTFPLKEKCFETRVAKKRLLTNKQTLHFMVLLGTKLFSLHPVQTQVEIFSVCTKYETIWKDHSP